MTMSCDDAGTKPVHRLEVFTGAGHRREWSDETRSAIIAESYAGAESVSAVARRYGLAPSQLFTWRRNFRRTSQAAAVGSAVTPVAAPFFVPAVIDAQSAPIPSGLTPVVRQRRVGRKREAVVVELEIDGVAVKIARGADAKTIAAVIDALRARR
jgi:transposase